MKIELGGKSYDLKVSLLGSGFSLDEDLRKHGIENGVAGALQYLVAGGLSLGAARIVFRAALVECVGVDEADSLLSTYLQENHPILDGNGLVYCANTILMELAYATQTDSPEQAGEPEQVDESKKKTGTT